MFDLDFSLLPTIVRHRVFLGLPPFIEEPLAALRLPETLDRLRAASLFLVKPSPGEKEWLNRANLRAGLSEFRSVSQALHWDLGRRDVYTPDQSRNPLVHLVFRLRRLAVYVANAPAYEREVTATVSFGDVEHSAEIKVLLIEDIERYLRKERLTGYRDEDISRICEWFDENQRIYGASQVLDIGVLLWAQELCDVYSDRAGRRPGKTTTSA